MSVPPQAVLVERLVGDVELARTLDSFERGDAPPDVYTHDSFPSSWSELDIWHVLLMAFIADALERAGVTKDSTSSEFRARLLNAVLDRRARAADREAARERLRDARAIEWWNETPASPAAPRLAARRPATTARARAPRRRRAGSSRANAPGRLSAADDDPASRPLAAARRGRVAALEGAAT